MSAICPKAAIWGIWAKLSANDPKRTSINNPLSMAMSPNIPWSRIFAEGAAIVVSILLAFWIQAWWEDRQRQVAEKELLEVLLPEIHLVQSNAAWNRTYNEAILESTKSLLRLATGLDKADSEKSIDGLLADIWWYQTPNTLAAPRLSSIASSGDLALVSNIRLRHELGAWPAQLQLARELLQIDLNFYEQRLMPFLSEHGHLPQILNSAVHAPGHPEAVTDYSAIAGLAATTEHSILLADIEFQNLLAERYGILEDLLTSVFSTLDSRLGSTVMLLEAELAL